MENAAKFNVEKFQEDLANEFTFSKWRFYPIFMLLILPGLCYASIMPDFATINAEMNVRCKIDEIEGNSWTFKEKQNIAQPRGIFKKECHKYDVNYSEFTNKPYEYARNTMKTQYRWSTEVKRCFEFVVNDNIPERFKQEVNINCDDTNSCKHRKLYFIGLYVTGACLILPYADLCGRKTIISIGTSIAFLSVFISIISLNYWTSWISSCIYIVAFPCLMIPALSIVFEISSSTVRNLVVLIIFLGAHIPELFHIYFDNIYWTVMRLVYYTPLLCLPLFEWYMPESPMWFVSKGKYREAVWCLKTFDRPDRHNEILLAIRNNQKLQKRDFLNFLREFRKANFFEMALLIYLFIAIGYASYKPVEGRYYVPLGYQNNYHVLRSLCGISSILLVIPISYILDPFYALQILFMLQTIFHTFIVFADDGNYQVYLMISNLISSSSQAVLVLYANYRIPISHRCTCNGIFSFVSFITWSLVGTFVDESDDRAVNISTAVLNAFAYLGLATYGMRKANNKVVLHFEDILRTKFLFSTIAQ